MRSEAWHYSLFQLYLEAFRDWSIYVPASDTSIRYHFNFSFVLFLQNIFLQIVTSFMEYMICDK